MGTEVLIWSIFVLCVTGFLFLAKWNIEIGKDMEKLSKSMVTNEDIIVELKEIKGALIGDMKTPGVITILHEQKSKLEYMEKKCEKNHE